MHRRVERLAQLVQHALQIAGQLARELHPPRVAGMCERKPRRMEERPIEMRDGANVPRNTAMNADD